MKLQLASALACVPLSGCFAFFIPGSVIDKVAGAPTHCVAPITKVGDTFSMPSGAVFRVNALVGDSPYYCRNSPEGRRFGVNATPV